MIPNETLSQLASTLRNAAAAHNFGPALEVADELERREREAKPTNGNGQSEHPRRKHK